MSRSGYCDDLDPLELGRWRAQVNSAIRGRRGQAFLRELAAAMDAMPEKILIADELVDRAGNCCTLGVVCKSREMDAGKIDYEDPQSVGEALGIAKQLAAEVEFMNDEASYKIETPAQRWVRMREWVQSQIKQDAKP